MMIAQKIKQSTTVLSKAVELYFRCCASCHQHCSNKSSLRGREILQVELSKGLWMTPHRSIHNLFEWHAGQTCPCGRNPSDIMARLPICVPACLLSVSMPHRWPPSPNQTLCSWLPWNKAPLRWGRGPSHPLPLQGFDNTMYHFRALTGPCTLLSSENSLKLGRVTQLDVKKANWFLSNRRDGRRTPPFSHHRSPESILQEWTQSHCLAKASFNKTAVFTATDLHRCHVQWLKQDSHQVFQYCWEVPCLSVSPLSGSYYVYYIPFKRIERSVFKDTLGEWLLWLTYNTQSWLEPGACLNVERYANLPRTPPPPS